MSQPKTDPEVYRRAWEDYQACCKKEGFLPVVRYCERHQLKEGRFYEWLRRGGIKLSEVQEKMRRDIAHCVQPAAGDSFMAVEVGDVGAFCTPCAGCLPGCMPARLGHVLFFDEGAEGCGGYALKTP